MLKVNISGLHSKNIFLDYMLDFRVKCQGIMVVRENNYICMLLTKYYAIGLRGRLPNKPDRGGAHFRE